MNKTTEIHPSLLASEAERQGKSLNQYVEDIHDIAVALEVKNSTDRYYSLEEVREIYKKDHGVSPNF